MTHPRVVTLFLLLFFGISLASSAQNVGINTTGTTPSTNAILDLNTGNSRNLGFILPHVKLTSLTTFNPPIANAHTTSDTGLMVYNTNAALTNGNGVGCYVWSGAQWVFAGYISNKDNYQASPANPTGTTSTTGKMMGLAGSLTPTSSGTYLIIISGYAVNSKANTSNGMQIRTGTGTAPANAATPSGTAQGSEVLAIPTSTAQDLPFSVNAVVTGLTIGTTYWVDIDLLSSSASGTASIKNVSISAIEQ